LHSLGVVVIGLLFQLYHQLLVVYMFVIQLMEDVVCVVPGQFLQALSFLDSRCGELAHYQLQLLVAAVYQYMVDQVLMPPLLYLLLSVAHILFVLAVHIAVILLQALLLMFLTE
jgi:hypothetical protein